ncbi:nuclear transport factor 2 family protein [[Mycobacterium] crassicus]|uniref:Ketosteroid isomerase family protein n=1 Tax=[Mycobacterium] crassicus TaxID=2872309 RepID=A0ABU5XJ35_9MYCO|nr:ketosteroid isomerase family protein [Mycolicibacter sp. MYC098]MEB3021948.1 ketosteroid isomerase family protein [Mycolicibacter sp. MYC098]
MTDAATSALLATVERSPAAAAAHDRAGWVGLFAPDGRVEDPVGSRPHVGPEQIGRFYDTFIGPRDITFHRDLDIVRDTTVVRDLLLEVAMGSAVTMHIPAILRYDLRESAGQWQLLRLRAYWELPAMMRKFLGNGVSAMPAGLGLARALLGNQGLAGTAGFASGFRRPAGRGKRPVRTFLAAIASADSVAAQTLLSPGATVTFGDDTSADLAELSTQLAGARPVKVLAAGSTVAVSLASSRQRGVLFADVAGRDGTIATVRYFPGD